MADLRAQRTRQYLRDALMKVMEVKPYRKITIAEITEVAQVSKSSFYNHYETIDELLLDCLCQSSIFLGKERRKLGDFVDHRQACIATLEDIARSLEFLKANQNMAHVLYEEIFTSPYLSQHRDAGEELLMDHMVTMYGQGTLSFAPFESIARASQYSTFGLRRTWIMEGFERPVEDQAKLEAYCSLQLMAGSVGHAIEPVYLQTITEWEYHPKPSM